MSPEFVTADLRLSLMDWETSLLGRRIGRVEGLEAIGDPLIGAELLRHIEREAIASGFELMVSRVTMDQCPAVWSLEAAGFLSVDVGVTFEYRLAGEPGTWTQYSSPAVTMRPATLDDLLPLQDLVQGLFLNSYYYVSPFFSRAEADLLHRTWIANCVRRQRADEVLVAELSNRIVGFITCRALPDGVGAIDLVGVRPSHGSRGLGKSLARAALKCFRALGVRTVRVRTQITNLAAVGVYTTTGARLVKADTTLIKSLAV